MTQAYTERIIPYIWKPALLFPWAMNHIVLNYEKKVSYPRDDDIMVESGD